MVPDVITHKMVMDAAWELIEDQYRAGDSLSTLAKRYKTSRHTMTKLLKERGSFMDGRQNPSLELCKRGHDLKKFGRPILKTMPDGRKVKNGRECAECKRIRQRVDYES